MGVIHTFICRVLIAHRGHEDGEALVLVPKEITISRGERDVESGNYHLQ